MADNDKRGTDRVPAALRLKLRYTDVESFIDKYAANVSKGGIFIASRAPKPVGSLLRFEFQLADGSPVVRGEGKVVWVKEFDPSQPQKPHGMGVKFTRLDNQSKAILDRMLAVKGQARGEASGASPLPAESSGMVPLPAQGSGPRPMPGEGSGPRPIPAEGSAPRPIPGEGSAPRPIPAEGSGPRPIASARPLPRIEPGAAIPITLALQPALEELEALAREIGFTDEALAAALARAREIAAGANGDLQALLLEVGREAPPAPPPGLPVRRTRPLASLAAPLAAGVASAAAQEPLLDDDGEEHTAVDRGLGRIARVFGGSGEEGTAPGLPGTDYEPTALGFADADGEGEPTPLDVVPPYGDAAPRPPDDPAGGPKRGRLGDVVKKIFGK